MSDKRINNSIFLMFLISGAYCSSHHLSNEQFLELDSQHQILNYIAECPGVFDLMTEDEMVQEIDAYVAGVWMTAEKARVATGNKVVDLTRYIMARDGLPQDLAYAKLYRMELFKLLSDPETRLFLEDDAYLQKAYEAESVSGTDALYDFIRPEP